MAHKKKPFIEGMYCVIYKNKIVYRNLYRTLAEKRADDYGVTATKQTKEFIKNH